MRPIEAWFDEYSESHQNSTNKLIHWICVPLIVLSIIGLLASIPSSMLKTISPDSFFTPYLNWGTIAVILSLLFYCRLSVKLMIGLSLLLLIGVFLVEEANHHFSAPLWQLSIELFIAAWVGQFYGHKIEGKKPSFLKDIQFLLIGPAWLLSFFYKSIGIKY